MKQMRAPNFRKNSSPKDFAVALSLVRRTKILRFFGDQSRGRGGASEIEIFAKSAPRRKHFALRQMSPIGFSPERGYHDNIFMSPIYRFTY